MSRNLPNLLKRSYSAARNTTLIKILQSEIKHEQTLNPFQSQQQHHKYGKLGDFILDYDNSRTQDIVLRRKFNDGGEEIALSALLGPIEDDSVTRNVLMKVCVSKPKLRSLLQFDCVVYGKKGESGDGGSDFEVENAYYLPSLTCLGPEIYKGPSFSDDEPTSTIEKLLGFRQEEEKRDGKETLLQFEYTGVAAYTIEGVGLVVNSEDLVDNEVMGPNPPRVRHEGIEGKDEDYHRKTACETNVYGCKINQREERKVLEIAKCDQNRGVHHGKESGKGRDEPEKENSSLDPQLQDKFKNYLIARGVGEDLTNFLLLHLRKKENGQYVNWLCKVETLLTEDGPSVQQK
ncbi:hypothetical protein GIB67_042392 [Kingdonia uniflora]|uniref:Mitochondrial glycoprotein n=1 Tax=Kingdonia uniflora TaxID=39325 RepID=A0A7J7M836_9MAGN|nr:hypothetical protein GIB67_042392 [Kingdonia uniflora]